MQTWKLKCLLHKSIDHNDSPSLTCILHVCTSVLTSKHFTHIYNNYTFSFIPSHLGIQETIWHKRWAKCYFFFRSKSWNHITEKSQGGNNHGFVCTFDRSNLREEINRLHKQILDDRRNSDSQRQQLVRWVNCPDFFNVWWVKHCISIVEYIGVYRKKIYIWVHCG